MSSLSQLHCCYQVSTPSLAGSATAYQPLGSHHGILHTGTLPPSFANFTSMDSLDLGVNQFRGTLPSQWGQGAMPILRNLDVSYNQVPRSWLWLSPEQLWRCRYSWREHQGAGCRLQHAHDQHPMCRGSCLQLTVGAFVQLTGTIPQWGLDSGMAGIQVLWLNDNGLMGTLPQSLNT